MKHGMTIDLQFLARKNEMLKLVIRLCRGACPGIHKRGGPKSESLFFFFCFSLFQGGGPAQKLAEKNTFSTKKVAKYR